MKRYGIKEKNVSLRTSASILKSKEATIVKIFT